MCSVDDIRTLHMHNVPEYGTTSIFAEVALQTCWLFFLSSLFFCIIYLKFRTSRRSIFFCTAVQDFDFSSGWLKWMNEWMKKMEKRINYISEEKKCRKQAKLTYASLAQERQWPGQFPVEEKLEKKTCASNSAFIKTSNFFHINVDLWCLNSLLLALLSTYTANNIIYAYAPRHKNSSAIKHVWAWIHIIIIKIFLAHHRCTRVKVVLQKYVHGIKKNCKSKYVSSCVWRYTDNICLLSLPVCLVYLPNLKRIMMKWNTPRQIDFPSITASHKICIARLFPYK